MDTSSPDHNHLGASHRAIGAAEDAPLPSKNCWLEPEPPMLSALPCVRHYIHEFQ